MVDYWFYPRPRQYHSIHFHHYCRIFKCMWVGFPALLRLLIPHVCPFVVCQYHIFPTKFICFFYYFIIKMMALPMAKYSGSKIRWNGAFGAPLSKTNKLFLFISFTSISGLILSRSRPSSLISVQKCQPLTFLFSGYEFNTSLWHYNLIECCFFFVLVHSLFIIHEETFVPNGIPKKLRSQPQTLDFKGLWFDNHSWKCSVVSRRKKWATFSCYLNPSINIFNNRIRDTSNKFLWTLLKIFL